MYDMRKIIGDFAFIAMIIIIMAKFSSIFTAASFPLSIVVSDSMEPTLHRGDVVPWIPCSIDEIKKGDIVVYKSASYFNQKKYIVHRVDGIIIKDGNKFLITKGDANNYTDQAGPHVPEPPVNKEMLQGKLITFGKNVIKFPYAGYPWIFATAISKKMAAPITWRSPQKGHFLIFTPFLFFFSLLLILAVIWLPNGKSLQEKLHELIFGEERVSISSIISYSLVIFIPLLLFTSFFSFDSIKINEDTKDVPVFNPSWLKLRAIAFFEGKGKINFPQIFDIEGGKEKNIFLKNASGNIYVYSSPLWRAVPMNMMLFFYNLNPKMCIFLSSLLSAFILSFISSFILISISMIWDNLVRMIAYSSFISLHYGKTKFIKIDIKEFFKQIKSKASFVSCWQDKMNKNVLLLFILYIPFSLFILNGLMDLFLISILSSIIIAFFSYFMGIRFKNEIAFLSFSSSLLYSFLFVSKGMMYIKDGFAIRFIQFVAVSMLLSIFLFLLMFSIMLFTLYFIREIVERIDPVYSIEVGDI